MFHIVLFQPEIPPNTGNVIRLSANIGAQLHLIKPLGYDMSDRQLKRAGLDYHDLTHLTVHENWQEAYQNIQGNRWFVLSTKGSTPYHQIQYQANDVFLFGQETKGLPNEVVSLFPQEHVIKIPMKSLCRSINLSNSVAILAYEAWRQLGFI